MAPSSFPITRIELNEQKLQAANEIFKRLALGKEEERIRVFISLCEREPNLSLVRELVDPFLSALGFDVHYYRKDISFGIPDDQIESIMDSCEIMVALYTKEFGDEKSGYTTAGNVIREVGRAKPQNKLIFYEEGVKVENMTFSKIPCLPFTRNNCGKLLVDLVSVLGKSRLFEIRISRRFWQAE